MIGKWIAALSFVTLLGPSVAFSNPLIDFCDELFSGPAFLKGPLPLDLLKQEHGRGKLMAASLKDSLTVIKKLVEKDPRAKQRVHSSAIPETAPDWHQENIQELMTKVETYVEDLASRLESPDSHSSALPELFGFYSAFKQFVEPREDRTLPWNPDPAINFTRLNGWLRNGPEKNALNTPFDALSIEFGPRRDAHYMYKNNFRDLIAGGFIPLFVHRSLNNIEIGELLLNGFLPLGIPLRRTRADGNKLTSTRYFQHDQGHNSIFASFFLDHPSNLSSGMNRIQEVMANINQGIFENPDLRPLMQLYFGLGLWEDGVIHLVNDESQIGFRTALDEMLKQAKVNHDPQVRSLAKKLLEMIEADPNIPERFRQLIDEAKEGSLPNRQ